MNNLIGILISILFIVCIMIAAKVFEKSGKEVTRKFIHIMVSNWWIIAMVFFDNMWCAAIVPTIFVIVNYISYKSDLIKVMEREDGEENKDSMGTVYYAFSLLVLSLITFGPLASKIEPFYSKLIGLCGAVVMGYGDGLAAVIGQRFKSKEYKIGDSKKTVAGSIAMFVITLMIMIGFYYYVGASYWIIKAIIVSVIMTIIEAVSPKGTDNISVPLLTSLLAGLLM